VISLRLARVPVAPIVEARVWASIPPAARVVRADGSRRVLVGRANKPVGELTAGEVLALRGAA
jgi:hypothetical protein